MLFIRMKLRCLILWLLGCSAIPLWATNPDLTLAPSPNISQAAWAELRGRHKETKAVTLHAQIAAKHGAVNDVVVRESDRFPVAAAEVQTWIKQHWKFVPAFTGTVVQPVSFQIAEGASSPAFSNDSIPTLSRAAWLQLQGKASNQPNVTIHVNLRANQGALQEVTVQEADQWPKASAEVEAWIRKYWKFGTPFTGSTVKSISYSLGSAARHLAWKDSSARRIVKCYDFCRPCLGVTQSSRLQNG
jgi:hypothetical protein